MASQVILICMVIATLILSCHAFWWSSSSTTESPVQAVKQIPLGYFRTYTYQPVGAAAPYSFSIVGTPGNPFNWPPKLTPGTVPASSSRYELYSLPQTAETAKTTSPPTTTTTTTTTSTAPPSSPPPQTPTQSSLPAQDRMNSATKYYDQGAIYNRRSIPYLQTQGNFYRPYPYPDYSMPNQRSTVQFVPCMCPITVAAQSADLTERRTVPGGDEIVILESNGNEGDSTAENIVQLERDIEKKLGQK